jgi:molybdopterin-synthase adenylyltransferase
MNNNILAHELAYREEEAIEKIKNANIFVCGVGAIGSNLADNLLRQGFSDITVIDDDVVEEHNIGTQSYCIYDVGIPKTKALSRKVFRDIKQQIQVYNERLTDTNINILSNYDLIIDVFDNQKSRVLVTEYCENNDIHCVHAGMSGDGYFQIIWNEKYIVPNDDEDAIDICEYPLARNLVMLTVSFLSEIIVKYMVLGEKINLEFTLGDLKISQNI